MSLHHLRMPLRMQAAYKDEQQVLAALRILRTHKVTVEELMFRMQAPRSTCANWLYKSSIPMKKSYRDKLIAMANALNPQANPAHDEDMTHDV